MFAHPKDDVKQGELSQLTIVGCPLSTWQDEVLGKSVNRKDRWRRPVRDPESMKHSVEYHIGAMCVNDIGMKLVQHIAEFWDQHLDVSLNVVAREQFVHDTVPLALRICIVLPFSGLQKISPEIADDKMIYLLCWLRSPVSCLSHNYAFMASQSKVFREVVEIGLVAPQTGRIKAVTQM